MTQSDLWTTVENPCGKPAASRARLNASSFKDKSLNGEPLVDALVDAVDLLAARIDGLEHQLLKLIGILDQPLSLAESIQRLRQLRDEMV